MGLSLPTLKSTNYYIKNWDNTIVPLFLHDGHLCEFIAGELYSVCAGDVIYEKENKEENTVHPIDPPMQTC